MRLCVSPFPIMRNETLRTSSLHVVLMPPIDAKGGRERRPAPKLAALLLVVLEIGLLPRTESCPPGRFAADAEAITLSPRNGGDPEIYLPVFRHHPESGKDPEVGLIVLHGAYRDAFRYYGLAVNAMKNAQAEESTVVVTPAFANRPCDKSTWLRDAAKKASNLNSLQVVAGKAAQWSVGTREWVNGQKGDSYEGWQGISSYEAIDTIIEWMELKYPSLEKIVVAGWSAGAQMGLRWSIVSSQGIQGITNAGTPMKIIMGSPSSVLYLNGRRPVKECTPNKDTGPAHICDHFRVPGTSHHSAKTCNGQYDNYPFGLSTLDQGSLDIDNRSSQRDVSEYVHKYIDDVNTFRKHIPNNFHTKDIRFVFGDSDTMSCFEGTCANDCEAMVQGSNRLQRNLNFMGHLRDVYPGYEPNYSVFRGGHNSELFFASDAFNEVVFGTEGFATCVHSRVVCFLEAHSWFVSAVMLLAMLVAAFSWHLYARKGGYPDLSD